MRKVATWKPQQNAGKSGLILLFLGGLLQGLVERIVSHEEQVQHLKVRGDPEELLEKKTQKPKQHLIFMDLARFL